MLLEVCGLTKKYGRNTAVENVTFAVNRGEILGLLGTNGAGKSTAMNMITGYLASTSGQIFIDGQNILENPLEARKKIGYLPEHPPLYPEMSVGEYLRFVYQLKKVSLPRKQHLQEICGLLGLDQMTDRIIKNLSKGYQQRVGIAQAMIGFPDLIILDEPTVGLDPKQVVEIRELIRMLGKKHTVILSSHILSEVQALCSRILIIHHGKLIADGSALELTNRSPFQQRLKVSLEGDEQKGRQMLLSLKGTTSVAAGIMIEDGVYEYAVEQEPLADIRLELFHQACAQQLPIMGLSRAATTLEDIFISLISGTMEHQEE